MAAAVERGARDLRVLAPAKVVKWDADKQRADCQVLVKDVARGEDDSRQPASVPVVTGVPVQFMTDGYFSITCPISDGSLIINGTMVKATTGSLIFAHRSLDKWLSGDGAEVDPELDHDHGENDAVFVPGLRPFGAPLASVAQDSMSLGVDGNDGLRIHVFGDHGTLGDDLQAQFMFLAETLLGDVKSAVTTLNTILLGGTAGGPTAQQITQAAQWALTNLYLNLQISPSPYLSKKWKNR